MKKHPRAIATHAASPVLWLFASLALASCSGRSGEVDPGTASAPVELAQVGEAVEPPFAVRGELEGLLLTWFDADGTHTADSLSDVPEGARAEVRVDSLSISPDERDPDSVFVADLRAAGEGGRYAVRRVPREAFEARVRAARTPSAAPGDPAAVAGGEVIVFGASWCGACRQAEAYLTQRGVPFVEHDIEEDPAARQDMYRRARAAGIQPNGIPIIDVRGRVLQGFDPGAIDRALRETGGASPAAPSAPPSAAPGVTI